MPIPFSPSFGKLHSVQEVSNFSNCGIDMSALVASLEVESVLVIRLANTTCRAAWIPQTHFQYFFPIYLSYIHLYLYLWFEKRGRCEGERVGSHHRGAWFWIIEGGVIVSPIEETERVRVFYPIDLD